jgi:DNA helicase II / ATP-dependent DNA helicase PcrA
LDIINGFSAKLYTEDAYELSMHIAKASGIYADLKADNSYESVSRLENIEGLLNSIKEFSDANKNGPGIVTLDKYLENVALLTDADSEKDEDRDKVSLMTIHSAKGLEFDFVFIAGVEEDLFPSKMSVANPQELEEERRLFYVALTRAGKQASISYAAHRYKWGTPTICAPSRFIRDIDEKYLDMSSSITIQEPEELSNGDEYDVPYQRNPKPRTEPKPKVKPAPILKSVAPISLKKKLVDMKTASRLVSSTDENIHADDLSNLKAGITVVHQQFGIGKVIAIEGDAPNNKAVVLFEKTGEKKLLLKFAKLNILD